MVETVRSAGRAQTAADVPDPAQLRSLFGQGRHPDADRLVAVRLATVKVTGADLVFRPQPTLQLLWALRDEETRKVIEAVHEQAIAVVLAGSGVVNGMDGLLDSAACCPASAT
ncbi:relaxase domain-containing protein [Streptomyces sp. NPDC101776]|uniref:relaxase domain-containing protein n=1 Tax=Streptomyces sp. NPDC101776 TaxID=3366146 RepID=UPI00381B130C